MGSARSLAFLISLCAGACGGSRPWQGEIVSRSGDGSGTLTVFEPMQSHGRALAEMPGGKPCTGTFSPLDEDAVKKLGESSPPIPKTDVATMVELSCGGEGVVRCGLARRAGGGFGFGACKDEAGREYKLRF